VTVQTNFQTTFLTDCRIV